MQSLQDRVPKPDAADDAPTQHDATSRNGTRFVDGARCVCGKAIKPGDWVKANFARRRVETGGGMYLVEEWRNGALIWSGCRRMMRVPNGISIDNTGTGEWGTYDSIAPLVVVATVEAVYRDVFKG